MINRILIRIKAVQLLYSYLLTKREFHIEQPPTVASRDRKYAYSLYLDFLQLIILLSGKEIRNSENVIVFPANPNKLTNTKFVEALAASDELRSYVNSGKSQIAEFKDALAVLNAKILKSAALRDFSKKNPATISDEIKLWKSIFNTIVLKEPKVMDVLRKSPYFSNFGFEICVKMLMETLSDYDDSRTSLIASRNALENSFDKSYELYISLLLLVVELTNVQTQKIETAKTKFLATDEDINPNTRFIDNKLAEVLKWHSDMEVIKSKNAVIAWDLEPNFIKTMLDKIVESEIYAEYMSKDSSSLLDDCEFWRKVLKNIIFTSEELSDLLEEKSIYWNDDLETIGTFVLKTIKQIAKSSENETVELLPKYKNEEDAEFGKLLFNETVNTFENSRSLINNFINNSNWDADRIAFMDMVIMAVAITEIIQFPKIPIAVTMNEYIEIANFYSTAKSGQFINGILYSVIKYLKNEGIINKE